MDLKCQPNAGDSNICITPNESWVVAPSKIHGRGILARSLIPRGTRILEYLGERISKAESLRRCQLQNEYIFSVSEHFDLDGKVEWNLARFLNHSCEPNCEALLDNERISIIAIRDIAAGEELTFNYGYDLEDYHNYPCNCGTSTCTGFMVGEEFFDHVRKQRYDQKQI